MKSLTEVARDLNAIKTERAHARIVLPTEAQEDENYRLLGELLKDTDIAQDELAAIALEVGQSAVHALDAAAPDGGIDGMELIGLIASLWIDGLTLGVRYMAQRSAIRPGGAEGAPDGSNGAEPAHGTDPTRAASQDDPRGERDR